MTAAVPAAATSSNFLACESSNQASAMDRQRKETPDIMHLDLVELNGCDLYVPSEDLVGDLRDRFGCNTLQDRRRFRNV